MRSYRIEHRETRTVFVDVPADSWTEAFEKFEQWSDGEAAAASLADACRRSDRVETHFVALTSWEPGECDGAGACPRIVEP